MKLEKTKRIQTVSFWFAIASVLVFFINIIAFISMAVLGKLNSSGPWTALTLSTEFITLACDIVWMILAIIGMIEGKKNKVKGPYAETIIAIILSIGLLFVSLLVFFTVYQKASDTGVSVETAAILSFILFAISGAGSIMYINACTRWKNAANGIASRK